MSVKHASRRSLRLLVVVLVGALATFSSLVISGALVPRAQADGGAPNLAYVAGTTHGISVIDVAMQQVSRTITTHDPHTILLSVDGRFLYVTEPSQGRVAVLAAKTGQLICAANVPGQPSLLAVDPGTSMLYTAGSGGASVTEFDPSNCSVKRTFTARGPVYGLAVAVVGSGTSGTTGNLLWVADSSGLSVFDDLNGHAMGSIDIPGGARYASVPPGATVYAGTGNDDIVAVDLNSHHVTTLLKGGSYGPMDYDAITGEVYVPDQKNNQLIVLTPVNAGFPIPKEPNRVIKLKASPVAVAITNDGQLGFTALNNGDVVMLDVPGRQVIKTIHVGGSPTFIITGVYPPVIGTTPQQASIFGTLANIAAYALVIALFIVPILLFRRYARADKARAKEKQDTQRLP